jgi:hypothetical protein
MRHTRFYPVRVSVSLNTQIKPRESCAADGADVSQRRLIEASGDSYEDAYAALMAQVPTGWVVIGVKRW